MDSFKIHNPATGTTHKVILGPDGNPISYVEQQVMPDTEIAWGREKNEYEHNKHRPNTQRHMKHVATLPATIHAELRRKGILDDRIKMMKWLEENRHFLVTVKDRI